MPYEKEKKEKEKIERKRGRERKRKKRETKEVQDPPSIRSEVAWQSAQSVLLRVIADMKPPFKRQEKFEVITVCKFEL